MTDINRALPWSISAETLSLVLDAVPAPVFIIDRQHNIPFANAAFCQFFGTSREQMREDGDGAVLSPEQREAVHRVDDLVFANGMPIDNEEVVTDGRGGLRVVHTSKHLIHLETPEGRTPYIVAHILDVTEVRETEAKARFRAEHDDLTGLFNRAQFLAHLSVLIDGDAGKGKLAAVVMLDVDGFKAVNDRHGSVIGDEFLRTVARRLLGQVRNTDLLARINGDSFGIIVGDLRQPSDVDRLAERILAAVGAPMSLGGHPFSPSISVGAAVYPMDAVNAENLIRLAEQALNQSRQRRRHAYLRSDGANADVVVAPDHQLADDMPGGLARGEFFMVFQPQVDAKTGLTTGFEALARWRHPERGLISPEIFIGLAEKSGFIHEFGRWVLEESCRQAAGWPWPLRVAVNASPIQLESEDFVTAVAEALKSTGLDARRLEIEVTETALLGNTDQVIEVFERLKSLGVAIALDDFGTGWSSLATLQRFRFDRLKIDRSFVERMEFDTRSLAIVRAVLNLGQALDVPVTAEGVEHPGQFAALKQLGCAELQGFILGLPEVEASLVPVVPWTSRAREA
ncbi:putative bifunctional diguanylate cyclase/phosphodiesterase [Zavarzinia sp.]|uniref:putative bifunctional diguanylate cyclase/phosphodiesterase n=1 Tax=Zavarzinia sp. TaxID=2027920 RepID=UPI003BB7736E|nr:EAL domain-containing protein [Zavarzinia sp.]